jgi:hypothetical protein
MMHMKEKGFLVQTSTQIPGAFATLNHQATMNEPNTPGIHKKKSEPWQT